MLKCILPYCTPDSPILLDFNIDGTTIPPVADALWQLQKGLGQHMEACAAVAPAG